jgi:hypothetical protein
LPSVFTRWKIHALICQSRDRRVCSCDQFEPACCVSMKKWGVPLLEVLLNRILLYSFRTW